jgi:hypothetical protein
MLCALLNRIDLRLGPFAPRSRSRVVHVRRPRTPWTRPQPPDVLLVRLLRRRRGSRTCSWRIVRRRASCRSVRYYGLCHWRWGPGLFIISVLYFWRDFVRTVFSSSRFCNKRQDRIVTTSIYKRMPLLTWSLSYLLFLQILFIFMTCFIIIDLLIMNYLF